MRRRVRIFGLPLEYDFIKVHGGVLGKKDVTFDNYAYKVALNGLGFEFTCILDLHPYNCAEYEDVAKVWFPAGCFLKWSRTSG